MDEFTINMIKLIIMTIVAGKLWEITFGSSEKALRRKSIERWSRNKTSRSKSNKYISREDDDDDSHKSLTSSNCSMADEMPSITNNHYHFHSHTHINNNFINISYNNCFNTTTINTSISIKPLCLPELFSEKKPLEIKFHPFLLPEKKEPDLITGFSLWDKRVKKEKYHGLTGI